MRTRLDRALIVFGAVSFLVVLIIPASTWSAAFDHRTNVGQELHVYGNKTSYGVMMDYRLNDQAYRRERDECLPDTSVRTPIEYLVPPGDLITCKTHSDQKQDWIWRLGVGVAILALIFVMRLIGAWIW